MENNKIDDKDIKLAVQKKQIDEQNEIIVNLQVQIEKLYRENQELSKPQSE
ncbi:hypothetical protein [Staphylococcus sp. GDX8P54P]|uniref:hypothetical protein n=1 Tax=Staphylococcus sp. GDX8P54P TaxID=2804099 RepID=UPI00195006AD|nr:hypothetical protein [Staphylococcus sp. GDX8P54P]